jgi:hypothetical protein
MERIVADRVAPSWAEKIAYWIATLLMFALMLIAVIGYHARYEGFVATFASYGFPQWAVLPLAYLKLLALLVIAINRWGNLKHIAYGAYFINMVAATYVHVANGEQPIHAYIGLVVVIMSYVLSNRVRGVPPYDAFILSVRSS